MKIWILFILTISMVSGCLRNSGWLGLLEGDHPPVLSAFAVDNAITAVYPEQVFSMSFQYDDPDEDIHSATLMLDQADPTTHTPVAIIKSGNQGTVSIPNFSLKEVVTDRKAVTISLQAEDRKGNLSNFVQISIDLVPWVPSLLTDFGDGGSRWFLGETSSVGLYSDGTLVGWYEIPFDLVNYLTFFCVGSPVSATTFNLEECYFDWNQDSNLDLKDPSEGSPLSSSGEGVVDIKTLSMVNWQLIGYTGTRSVSFDLDMDTLPTAALRQPTGDMQIQPNVGSQAEMLFQEVLRLQKN